MGICWCNAKFHHVIVLLDISAFFSKNISPFGYLKDHIETDFFFNIQSLLAGHILVYLCENKINFKNEMIKNAYIFLFMAF